MDDKTRQSLVAVFTKQLIADNGKPPQQIADRLVAELAKHWPATMNVKGKGQLRLTKIRPGGAF